MDIKQSGRAATLAAASPHAEPLRGGHLRRLAIALLIALALYVSGRGYAQAAYDPEPGVQPGTIVISTSQRRLYLMGHGGPVASYPVAVGKPGKQWYGWARIDGKYVEPAWSPPAEVKRENPRLPDVIPGGSPRNPMGKRALTLDRDEIAIHGTNRPGSIGTYASYGCIRMHNRDIVDLFERVRVGTPVLMVR
ncbi:L,D-transpeptidase [Enterovirga aerilata]|uniref:L,D-transpeptidase n=1 Tax=Enterovirga aerilata TaxID=2730920 RepID=A0A849I798_9HYPH|nr:L,D-transpeptidase [Enterovirga sp. DB1703]NNM73624.1 L,D-transpeptidase [Enterovirga sp. DB1703]